MDRTVNPRPSKADSEAAWLKLSLLSHGISPAESSVLSDACSEVQHVTRLNIYNSPVWGRTSDLLPQEIRLSDNVICAVNVYGAETWMLTATASEYKLSSTSRDLDREVKAIPQLKAYQFNPDLRGTSNLYGGSALAYFTPRGCVYFSDESQCQFCSLAGTASSTTGIPARLSADAIAHNIEAVLEHDAARLNQIMIVGGTLRDLDQAFLDYVEIAQTVSSVLARSGLTEQISIHLATMPPSDQTIISELKGISNLHVMFNLEVWDEDNFMRIAPGKARHYGRERLLSALDRLVDSLGPYRGHSLLIGGLEPPEITYAGGRELAKRGISVINNLFHSDRYSQLGLAIRPSFDELRKLASLVQDLYDEYPIIPYWKGCGRNAIDYEASLGLYRASPVAQIP